MKIPTKVGKESQVKQKGGSGRHHFKSPFSFVSNILAINKILLLEAYYITTHPFSEVRDAVLWYMSNHHPLILAHSFRLYF